MSNFKKFKVFGFTFLFFLINFFSKANANANDIENIRLWQSTSATRIVFDLDNKPKFSYFLLTSPNRLVIDFKNTSRKFNFSKIKKNNAKLIKKIRSSQAPTTSTFRIVVELNSDISTPKIFHLSPSKSFKDRLVVDLKGKNTKPTPSKEPVPNKIINPPRDIMIAIDPGHGGKDPGAISTHGIYEKNLTLEISRRLKKRIDKLKGFEAFLIRNGDYYVELNDRTEIARKKGADLLVSVHADAFYSKKPRGASVWVLSNRRANSEIGKWLEEHEKQSQLLGGAGELIEEIDQEEYLRHTLLDMSMDNTRAEGFEVAADILSELKKVTVLHKSRPAAASLAVLKAPDIPSILVETGFLSNLKDARALNTSAYQEKVTSALSKGIKGYFYQNPPKDTYIARLNQSKTHIVKRGESLSFLASRYDTSVNNIKTVNELSSNNLLIGQKILVPMSF